MNASNKKKTFAVPQAQLAKMGGRIVMARRLKGWGQKILSAETKIPAYRLSRIESGRYPPDAFELKAISEKTDQKLEWFYKD